MDNQILEQNANFGMSNKYKTITTKNVLTNLEAEGYVVNSFTSAKVRKKTKDGFQKHLCRISRPDLDLNIEGLRPEIILINSHDGSSSFRLLVGIYRFACANGLIVGSSYFQRNIRHVGEVMPKVLTAVEEVKRALPMVAQDIEKFSKLVLTQSQKETFALNVAKQVVDPAMRIVDPSGLLEVRRAEDQGDDLFTVLNVVQENVLQGNLTVQSLNDAVKLQPIRKMRKVKSLTRSTEINQLIWDAASQAAA